MKPQAGDLITLQREYMGRTSEERLRVFKAGTLGVCLLWSEHSTGSRMFGGVLRMLVEGDRVTFRTRDEMPAVRILSRLQDAEG